MSDNFYELRCKKCNCLLVRTSLNHIEFTKKENKPTDICWDCYLIPAENESSSLFFLNMEQKIFGPPENSDKIKEMGREIL